MGDNDAMVIKDPAELKRLIGLLSSAAPGERREAAEMLGHAGHPSAVESLRKITNDPDMTVRFIARRSLKAVMERFGESFSDRTAESDVGTKLESGVTNVLKEIESLLSDADPKKRMSALKLISVKRLREAMPLLVERVERERDPFVIATMVKVIGLVGDRSALVVLSKFLQSSDPRVRANTVEGISFVHDNAKVELLEPLVNDADNRIRANALMALFPIKESYVIDELRRMLESDLEAVRDSAVYVIGRIEKSQSTNLRQRFGTLLDSQGATGAPLPQAPAAAVLAPATPVPALPAGPARQPAPPDEPSVPRDLYLKDITSILLQAPRVDVGLREN